MTPNLLITLGNILKIYKICRIMACSLILWISVPIHFLITLFQINILNRTPYRNKIPSAYMRVNLCRTRTPVSKQLLNVPDVNSIFMKMSGVTVPQTVNTYILPDTCIP